MNFYCNDYIIFLQDPYPIWVPRVIYGFLAALGAVLIMMLPETNHQPLMQTVPKWWMYCKYGTVMLWDIPYPEVMRLWDSVVEFCIWLHSSHAFGYKVFKYFGKWIFDISAGQEHLHRLLDCLKSSLLLYYNKSSVLSEYKVIEIALIIW